ncbi:MAG: chemotaxis protein [Nitrospinota bacterium]
MSQTDMLLESGTNELEIVEFRIDFKRPDGEVMHGYYGVNVGKVREIIRTPESFSDVPKSHPAVAGMINLRGKIIPVIDLPIWLNKDDPNMKRERVIITEFNNVTNGFMVHTASRIHRVSWDKVESPSGIMNQAERECVTGLLKFDEKIIMLLDFERIVSEIFPGMSFTSKPIKTEKRRNGKTIFVVEDSAFVRQQMVGILKTAGYRVFMAENGLEALNKLTGIADDSMKKSIPIERYLNLIISDVEMPKMDGLHLTMKIKDNPILKNIPVVVFSSMVNVENKKKWASLGAVDFIGKPDIDRLVHIIDSQLT